MSFSDRKRDGGEWRWMEGKWGGNWCRDFMAECPSCCQPVLKHSLFHPFLNHQQLLREGMPVPFMSALRLISPTSVPNPYMFFCTSAINWLHSYHCHPVQYAVLTDMWLAVKLYCKIMSVRAVCCVLCYTLCQVSNASNFLWSWKLFCGLYVAMSLTAMSFDHFESARF